MGLYEKYLNWRIGRVRNALAETERRFYASSEGIKKAMPRADECGVYQGDSDALQYLGRIGVLKQKERGLVKKLSQAGVN